MQYTCLYVRAKISQLENASEALVCSPSGFSATTLHSAGSGSRINVVPSWLMTYRRPAASLMELHDFPPARTPIAGPPEPSSPEADNRLDCC